MTQPVEGDTYKKVHGDMNNALAIFKSLTTFVLIRPYRAGLTNLCDEVQGTVFDPISGRDYMTPYAEDGSYREDLYDPDFPGGQWYNTGLIEDTGSKLASNFDTEKVMTAQLIRAARWDETAQDNELSFVIVEFNEVAAALRSNLDLHEHVQDMGGKGRVWVTPSEPTGVTYQAMVCGEDNDKRAAIVIPKITRKGLGDLEFNRKNPVKTDLKYGLDICPFADTPFYILPEGAGFRAIAGAPVWSSAPTATGGAGTASVVFTVPTLANDPAPDTFTYAYEKKVAAGSWVSAGAPASTVASGVQVTVGFTGLAAGSTQFRVIATAQSGQASTSDPSTAVTITA